MKYAVYAFIGLISFIVGGQMAAYFFFGAITLIGFIVLVETISPLKWLIVRTSSLIDILIFVFTIMATASLGVTVTAALTFAGLGFTLVYAPWLRSQRKKRTK